ncbi:oxidoreductase [Asticcacaulis sp. SL142]|uniref:oxidoreductase n=1 Tax=Asticcacaulis sp. SL142 TaxID=2995155 RepID=UPI00226C70F5|nr:oxidoreductase [Asticcacaulis sp. SL142]WAC49648.1 oxidoreductase [Asticcacaulis sp. SL142]
MSKTSKPAKTAVVTGASSGMGHAIALQLIKDGYRVYVAARSVDKMADLVAEGAIAIKMDISVAADVDAAAQTILSQAGTVDVLVNNAGYGLFGAMEDIGIDEARYQFEVNVFGPARLTQLLLPAMRAKRAGTIVNITSMGGKIYTLLGSWYHATKHALEGWSDCLRLELEPLGIRVVVIEPGIIDTGFGDVVVDGILKRSGDGAYAEVTQRVAKVTLQSYKLGTGTKPEVIARVISKAIKARRPKTRYAAGRYAKMMISVRKWFGDRAFDSLILSQMK